MTRTSGPRTAAGLPRGLTWLLAAAAGLSVANIYAAQPLLDAIARDLGVAPASIGVVVTVTQLGYAAGLVLLVPLGDLVDRRRLIVAQVGLGAAALVAAGLAPGLPALLGAMAAVGVLAVVVQALVAFAATLAPPDQRGSVVGTVTGGVVTGILLARLAAGGVAELGGWRLAYLVAAGLNAVLALLLWHRLPRHGAVPAAGSYAGLLASTLRLFAEEPVLRVRAILACLIFATFSTFWTALVLPLSAPPLALSPARVGLFGLIGVAGALGARAAGRLVDRGLGQPVTGASLLLLLTSWVPIALMERSLWLLVLGIVLLDLAIQAVHVTSQTMILARRPEAAGRLIGGYMVFYSIGSALGAIGSTAMFAWRGWPGVCLLGAGFSLAALAFWWRTSPVGGRVFAAGDPAAP